MKNQKYKLNASDKIFRTHSQVIVCNFNMHTFGNNILCPTHLFITTKKHVYWQLLKLHQTRYECEVQITEFSRKFKYKAQQSKEEGHALCKFPYIVFSKNRRN